jgi:hypothetical protein
VSGLIESESPMHEKADVLAHVCMSIEAGSLASAASLLASEYPFTPISKLARQYSASECMQVFVRDGFIDRYSGKRLVFPGTLRLLSKLLPSEFPFQTNWKSDACHFAYYELFPTIDHIIPVARGGEDREENWITTSMLRNAAKANFTVEEIGWSVHPCGDIATWDGLTGWFLRQVQMRPEILSDAYLLRWLRAARERLPGQI